MYQNEFDDISKSNDIYHLLNPDHDPQSIQAEIITDLLQQRSNKVSEGISKGDLFIFDPHQIKNQIAKLQQQICRKEKQWQQAQAKSNSSLSKSLKRQIIKLRQQQAGLIREQAKLKKKEILQKVKKWEQIQTEIRSKKQQLDAQKIKKQNQQAQKTRKEAEEQERRKRIQRKKQIQNKLNQIQNSRAKRQQIIKFAEIQYQKLQPKYLQIQKKYKQIENQIKFEEDILKKNHKLATLVDYTAIKQHEKEYMSMVAERNKIRSLKTSSVDQRTTQFTPFIFRDEAKIQQEKEKFKRRQQFEERLKEIPIHSDESITLRVEMQRDKGKNPLKYHFLGEKALSDQQIFKEFPNFEININHKEVGVEYLRELPTITHNSRITKSHSESLLTRQISTKEKYKDYLHDLKLSRPPRSELSEEDLIKQGTANGNKSKILSLLANKEKMYRLELQKRQQELQKYSNVKTQLKKIKQIDDIYSKSIKTKLVHLQLRQ